MIQACKTEQWINEVEEWGRKAQVKKSDWERKRYKQSKKGERWKIMVTNEGSRGALPLRAFKTHRHTYNKVKY